MNRDPQVEEAHRETERLLDQLRPHVLRLAVHVEALERIVEAEGDGDG